MGLLFKNEGHVVFKPAKDVDLTPASSELYLRANVKGTYLLFHINSKSCLSEIVD